jgi:hypothetical protein
MSLMRWRFAAISGGTASSNAVSRGLSVLSDPARSHEHEQECIHQDTYY